MEQEFRTEIEVVFCTGSEVYADLPYSRFPCVEMGWIVIRRVEPQIYTRKGKALNTSQGILQRLLFLRKIAKTGHNINQN